jgi:pimeloyl-ACP methyl ester carboxylesterase
MLTHPLRVLYLHGFASSPGSRKAQFFAGKLRELGFNVEVPDLAKGCFEQLTISGQLKLIETLSRTEPLILIGSSLGGYLAALYAARHAEVDRLILLAPAFGFHQLWTAEMGPDRLAEWRSHGVIPVFHYGEQREVPLGFQLMEDASRFEPFPDFHQPALIFHGNQDSSVPVQQSLAFVRDHTNARLVRLESGHDLIDVLEPIWKECETFVKADSSILKSVWTGAK